MKGDADEKDQSSEISMDAVAGIMSNTGYPAFNYDVFKRMYDDGEELKNIVADFDNENIFVKYTRLWLPYQRMQRKQPPNFPYLQVHLLDNLYSDLYDVYTSDSHLVRLQKRLASLKLLGK
jgi:hypothetical protein